MIYEMALRCVNDLRTRWTDVQTGLTDLRNALPTTDVVIIGQISTLETDISNHLVTIDDDPRDDNDRGFTDALTLLNNTRTTLNSSRSFLGTVDTTTSVFLPDLANRPLEAIARPARLVQERLRTLRQLIEICLQEIEEIRTAEGGRANLAGIRGSVENLSAYPVLTQETGYGRTPSYPSGGPSSATSLGQIVEGTLRNVLGWRPKTNDPKGFVAALGQSFTCKEVDGRTECLYTPRTYAVQVQADMGAITGAQASIYARAKAALDQSLIILDRLYALEPAADEQEVEASRAIIRTELTELVNELGVEGGPRVSRVDSLFELLRGPADTPADPELVRGQLRQMRRTFGLERDRVNTIEEEQNLTDFITLVDYINSLWQSWDAQRRFFDRSGTVQPFLGTQLVLVSRALAVVVESVQEVYFSLDSVFLGSAERQTIALTTPGNPSIFVGELLAWVERFASEEGPRLIQDGGKAGVRALFPTIDRLITLVQAAHIPPQDPNPLPAGYRTARVQRSVAELATYLETTGRLAREFLRTGNGV